MASATGQNASIRSIIEAFEGSLELARQQLIDQRPDREDADFDLSNFWTNFIGATKLVSHEATKLCMAFQGQGMTSTEECQCLVDKVEKICLALLAVFLKLPKTKGETLHKEIRTYVLDILQGMGNLCASIKNQRNTQLQSVGGVWEHCGNVERLSRDNRYAVAAFCREQLGMVQDALRELMETLEAGDTIFDLQLSLPSPVNGLQIPRFQTWSDSDMNVLLPSSGLVKASKACLKKTTNAISERGDGSNAASIVELDRISFIVMKSSSFVDNFVMALYPPMDHSVVRQQASEVRDNSKELLSAVRNSHFCSAVDEAWVDFLEKAVDHNWVRINDSVLTD